MDLAPQSEEESYLIENVVEALDSPKMKEATFVFVGTREIVQYCIPLELKQDTFLSKPNYELKQDTSLSKPNYATRISQDT